MRLGREFGRLLQPAYKMNDNLYYIFVMSLAGAPTAIIYLSDGRGFDAPEPCSFEPGLRAGLFYFEPLANGIGTQVSLLAAASRCLRTPIGAVSSARRAGIAQR